MSQFLDHILQAKREELASLKYATPLAELRSRCRDMDLPRPFQEALLRRDPSGAIRLVAEIKKASPSKGLLLADFDPISLATIYEDCGASALSVLTERFFFQGSPEHLKRARGAVSLPVLRKDFLLADYHVYEARAMGADAVLLIVRILESTLLKDLIALASELGIAAVVEVHTESEAETAVVAGARIIGINNRNLETFKVDLSVTYELLKKIPPGRTIISESGISTRQEVSKLKKQGVHAILVGEALVTSQDIRAKISELISGPLL
ncbi:MAG: indole-3-glycerol phosphate synthase TrpC [Nitrospirae bacterium]|nr:indole-3-glycerol phosphate synthase TrpC [Nitrospirota bacterium]